MASASVQINDLTQRITFLEGSIFFSIAALMYMGFKEIYLCGAGYTYEPVNAFHFYDNFIFPKSMGKENAEIEARKANDIRNQEVSSNCEYYGLSEKDNFYRGIYIERMDHDPHKEAHRILNDFATAQGVKIYNIVPDGFESPVYEKITWQELESGILSKNPGNL